MDYKIVKISKVLASNLIKLREQNGYTVIELANLCGITRQAIYQIESGKRWISQPLIEKLSEVYKIEEHELFQIEKSSKKPK